MIYGKVPMIGDVKFVETLAMTEEVEDWSRVRSPSRAARRMRQGHRQNVVVRRVPRRDAVTPDGGRTYYVHPEMMREFRRVMTTEPRISVGYREWEP